MSPAKAPVVTTTCLGLMLVAACNQQPSAPASPPSSSTPTQPAAEPAHDSPLAWNQRTLVEAYEGIGRHNPKWDVPAKAALNEFARTRARLVATNEPFGQIIGTNAAAAVQAGCDDPLIGYLHLRFGPMADSTNTAQLGAAFANVADALQQGSYPPIRQFYASLHAALTLKAASTNATKVSAAVYKFRMASINTLTAALQDPRMPAQEADDACSELLEALKVNHDEYEHAYNHLEPALFANWPNEAFAWLLKGAAHTEMAWRARGTDYSDKVTRSGWKDFAKHLDIAEQALDRAWQINPHDARIPLRMLTVELGQGKGRDRMELWFRRAMEIDPNDYAACYAKLYYLEPKWYGSEEDMLQFGRECVQSKRWGGHVPLILADAHWNIYRGYHHSDESYWQSPEVWDDLNAAFKRFFELNPQETSYRHNYAWYAYHCRQWGELNRQLTLLGWTNYDYFGGKAEFDQMARLAAQHAADSKPAQKN